MTDGIGYSNSATLNRIGGRKCIDGWMDGCCRSFRNNVLCWVSHRGILMSAEFQRLHERAALFLWWKACSYSKSKGMIEPVLLILGCHNITAIDCDNITNLGSILNQVKGQGLIITLIQGHQNRIYGRWRGEWISGILFFPSPHVSLPNFQEFHTTTTVS